MATSAGAAAGASFGIGFADSTAEYFSVQTSQSGVGTTQTTHNQGSTNALTLYDSTGVIDTAGSVSYGQGTIEAAFTNLPDARYKALHLAVHGSGSACKAGRLTGASGVESGLGFRPSLVFCMGGETATDASGADAHFAFGVSVGSSGSAIPAQLIPGQAIPNDTSAFSQTSAGYVSDDGVGTSDVYRYFSNTTALRTHASGSASWGNTTISVTNLEDDQFTWANTGANTSRPWTYLAVDFGDGGRFRQAGTEQTPTSTGIVEYSTNFSPKIVLFFSGGGTGVNDANDGGHGVFCVGVGGTTDAVAVADGCLLAVGDQDAAGTTDTYSEYSESGVLSFRDTSRTLRDFAKFDSVTAGGFKLDWTTADATQRRFAWIAIS